MQQPETRALWRAVTLLVLVSAGRWLLLAGGEGAEGGGQSVLPDLLTTSREAAADGARRAAPLGEGERIDPNRASEAELDRLPGVGPATARAIVAAREGGTVFRRPEDLLTVRGIGDATLERMRSDLDLSAPPSVSSQRARPAVARGTAAGPPSDPAGQVDLNSAGVEELQLLPGIGPALAQRIVAARKEQMFTSLDDLVRVRGIGEATIERLRARVVVGRAAR
jgi:competence ComEA-like helix-hairpin-helix protein